MFKRAAAAVTGFALLAGSFAGLSAAQAADNTSSRYCMTEEYRISGSGIVQDQTDGSNSSPQIKITSAEPAVIVLAVENFKDMGCMSLTFAQCGGSLGVKLTALETPDAEEGTLLIDGAIENIKYDWSTITSAALRFAEPVPENAGYARLEFNVGDGARNGESFLDYVEFAAVTLGKLRSLSNGRVVEVADAGLDNGNIVTAADDEENKTSQNWTVKDSGSDDGWCYIVNENSGKGIGMFGGTTAAGAEPVQWTPDGSTNQMWRFVKVDKDGSTYYKILNKNSRRVLTMNDANVTQEDWTGEDNQLWEYVSLYGSFAYESDYDDNYSIMGITAEALGNVISYSVMYTFGEGMVLEMTLSGNNDTQTNIGAKGTFDISEDGEYTLTASLYSDETKTVKVCDDLSTILTVENGGYEVIGAKWTASIETDVWSDRGKIETREVTDEDIEEIKNTADTYIIADQNTRYQTMDDHPWGGCFAEAGWNTMGGLTEEQRSEVIRSLFGTGEDSLNLTVGRTPIGSNDFGLDMYTYDETTDDYELNDFSIDRDKQHLIPYIKEAMKYCPDLRLFSSPWSPPSWMKTNNQLSGYASPDNTIEDTPENFTAYAKYFMKYLEAYAAEGIDIFAITPQNEPTMATAYPSCVWTGEQLNVFLRDYLSGALAQYNKDNGTDIELWLGTFTDSNKALVMPTLKDTVTRELISAVCFQWWGAPLASQVHMTDKNLKLVMSETKCGNGLNNWQYAEEQFDCFKEFLDAGTSQYFLWNMILDSRGRNNGGGWAQNAPITVDGTNIQYRPSYYLTKHFSSNIKPGARRIKVEGKNVGEGSVKGYVQDVRAIGFQNTDGEIVLNMKNSTSVSKAVTVVVNSRAFDVTLPAHSINTFKLDGTYENTEDATVVKEVVESTDVKFTNLATNNLLSCDGYNTGADVKTTTNQGESYQTWSLIPADDEGNYFLQNFRSDYVLCVWTGSKEEDAKISQYDNTDAADQMWALEFVEYKNNKAYYKIMNKNSGLALTALGEEDNNLVTQRAYTGADDQLWEINLVGGDWEFPEKPDTPSAETTVELSGGKYVLTTTLSNVEAGNSVVAAGYNEAGQCLCVRTSEARTDTAVTEFDADGGISYFKIMVWDSLEGMKPLISFEDKLAQ